MTQLGLLIIAPILVYAAYSDLRWLRIPNGVSLLMLAIFALVAMTLPWSELMWRTSIGATIFVIGLVLFAARLIGAGDVKLLSALLLFVPSSHTLPFFQLFSVSLLLGVAFISVCRRLPQLQTLGWRSVDTPRSFPMGISIALAGLLLPLLVATS